MLLWSLREKEGFYTFSSSVHHCSHRNVLRLYLWRQMCCGWHLVTQGQWPAVPADRTPSCSPRVQRNVSGAGQHLGEGCLKDVAVEGQGQQVSKVFHPGAFQISAPAQNWSTCGGNHSNFQCEAGEGTFRYEMWRSGLAALCEGSWTFQVLWGHKSSWFSAFGRPSLWHAYLEEPIPLSALPCEVHHSTVSLLVLPQKHTSVLLEVQQNLFWNIFLKKSAVPLLGQKVFLANSHNFD